MALDFYQSDRSRPLTQFRKEGGNDIKVAYIFTCIFWIQVNFMTSPLAYGVKEDQTGIGPLSIPYPALMHSDLSSTLPSVPATSPFHFTLIASCWRLL
jgi:hypothetical protein